MPGGGTPKDENSAEVDSLRRRGSSGKGTCFGAPSEAHQNINKKTLSRHPAQRIWPGKDHLRDVPWPGLIIRAYFPRRNSATSELKTSGLSIPGT